MAKSRKLKKFAKQYIINNENATKAAKKAGYSEKTAYQAGSRLLKNVEVLKEIEKLAEDGTDKNLKDVLKELSTLGFSKITDYMRTENGQIEIFDTAKIPPEAIPAIKKIKQTKYGIEFELHDKVRSLELLGSHLGLGKPEDKKDNKPTGGLIAALKNTLGVWKNED